MGFRKLDKKKNIFGIGTYNFFFMGGTYNLVFLTSIEVIHKKLLRLGLLMIYLFICKIENEDALCI